MKIILTFNLNDMKRYLFFLLCLFASTIAVQAIEILDVEPGDGTLNAAIKQYKGDRIYRLQNGYNGYYVLNEIINNTGFELTIIGGGEPDANDLKPTMPPTVQTNGAGGVPFNFMINAYANLKLQGIYFVNATADGVFNSEFFIGVQGNDVTVEIDNCIVDPSSNPFYVTGNNAKIYLTNNIFNRLTTQTTSVNGPVNFLFSNPEYGFDVLYIENNTFIGLSTSVFSDNLEACKTGLTWINHNSFIHHKCQIDWMANQEEYYFTNNLLYDCHVIPYEKAWVGGAWDNYPVGGVSELLWSAPDDKVKDKGVEIDWGFDKMTSFVAYNVAFKNKAFYDNLDNLYKWTDAKGAANTMYYMPLVWDENAPAYGIKLSEALEKNPQYKIYNSAGYPTWKQSSNNYTIDPQFNDSRIAEKSAILAQWALPATKKDYFASVYDGDDSYTKLDWYWDPDGELGRNETWPLFDGSYKNAEAQTYGIDGLPVGDLNWFPEKKAIWEQYKDEIAAHIKSLKTERIDLGSVESVEVDAVCLVYPNPASEIVNFTFSGVADENSKIDIYNAGGQMVKSVKINSDESKASVGVSGFPAGMYLYRAYVNGRMSKGIFIKK